MGGGWLKVGAEVYSRWILSVYIRNWMQGVLEKGGAGRPGGEGGDGAEEITSELAKRPYITPLNYLHASLPTTRRYYYTHGNRSKPFHPLITKVRMTIDTYKPGIFCPRIYFGGIGLILRKDGGMGKKEKLITVSEFTDAKILLFPFLMNFFF